MQQKRTERRSKQNNNALLLVLLALPPHLLLFCNNSLDKVLFSGYSVAKSLPLISAATMERRSALVVHPPSVNVHLLHPLYYQLNMLYARSVSKRAFVKEVFRRRWTINVSKVQRSRLFLVMFWNVSVILRCLLVLLRPTPPPELQSPPLWLSSSSSRCASKAFCFFRFDGMAWHCVAQVVRREVRWSFLAWSYFHTPSIVDSFVIWSFPKNIRYCLLISNYYQVIVTLKYTFNPGRRWWWWRIRMSPVTKAHMDSFLWWSLAGGLTLQISNVSEVTLCKLQETLNNEFQNWV